MRLFHAEACGFPFLASVSLNDNYSHLCDIFCGVPIALGSAGREPPWSRADGFLSLLWSRAKQQHCPSVLLFLLLLLP